MISFREFHRPKLGNSDEEYEDAFAHNGSNGRFAIADGASDSIFSNIWSKALVDAFVESDLPFSRDPSFLMNIIYGARKKWYNDINWDSLRTFVRNKALKGSFSTFLGLQTQYRNGEYSYRVLAVGDSCIFINLDSDILGFPLDDPSKFNITPKLIWSGYGSPFPEDYNTKLPEIKYLEGTFLPDQRVMLATDAISKWILENYPRSFEKLFSLPDPISYITKRLESREIRNDDITFAAITL